MNYKREGDNNKKGIDAVSWVDGEDNLFHPGVSLKKDTKILELIT